METTLKPIGCYHEATAKGEFSLINLIYLYNIEYLGAETMDEVHRADILNNCM